MIKNSKLTVIANGSRLRVECLQFGFLGRGVEGYRLCSRL